MRKATNLPTATKPPANGAAFFLLGTFFMQEYTTQRRTIIGYRCPGARGLSPTPEGPNCEMEITEVDEPISYIVSTGDDGFIAENDQKILLRDAAVRDIRFENNFQAGDPKDPIIENQKSCNHFIEGNHPSVYRRLRFLLVENSWFNSLNSGQLFKKLKQPI